MSKIPLMLSALAIGIATSGIEAGAKTVDAPKMTCEQFLALGGDVQSRAVVWLDGYSAGRLKQDVGEVDVDREMAALVVLCKENPQQSFWDKVRAHLPGGKMKLRPMQMTCQEFVDLDQTIQPEAAYWLHGYKAATIATEIPAGQVDLERDMGVMVVECKRAPTESLWARIRKHF